MDVPIAMNVPHLYIDELILAVIQIMISKHAHMVERKVSIPEKLLIPIYTA